MDFDSTPIKQRRLPHNLRSWRRRFPLEVRDDFAGASLDYKYRAEENRALVGRFIDRFKIAILDDFAVKFEIPLGLSRIDMLHEGFLLSRKLHNQKAVGNACLRSWEKNLKFTRSAVTRPKTSTIRVHVANTENLNCKKDHKKILTDVRLADLALAHLAYLVVTGKNLFDGHPVKVKGGGVINFVKYGLVYSTGKNYRQPIAIASYVIE